MRARDKLMNALHFKGYIPRVTEVIIVSLIKLRVCQQGRHSKTGRTNPGGMLHIS
jgi:hypothetical protein